MISKNFKDLLNKACSIFKDDMYIVNNRYLLAGDMSEKDSDGYYFCRLSQDSIKVCNEQLGEKEQIIYVENVRKAKDTFGELSRIVEKEDEKKLVLKKYKNLNKQLSTVQGWEKVKLTEEEINDLYDRCVNIELFKNESNIPTVTISKSFLPLTTEKNIDNLFYSVQVIENNDIDEGDIGKLFLSIDIPQFQLNMIYMYLIM